MNRRGAALLGGVAVVAVVVGGGLLFVRAGGPTVTAAMGAPRFIDETGSSGIVHTYDGQYPFSVGGGLAVFDCDDNGRPDLFIAGGTAKAVLYRNTSPLGGALTFAAVDDPVIALTAVLGAYPIDFDGDRKVDLMVLRDGESLALRGLGGCRFEPDGGRLGLPGGDAMTTAFSATWEGSQALPTLALGSYLVDPDNPDPDNLCGEGQLVRPGPDGRRYGSPDPLTPAWCPLSMLFSDWDRSGRRDLRISNDREYYSDVSDGEEQLWRVAPGESPRPYGAADGWATYRIYGMGIASYDVTGDGYPDAYLTSQGPNVLHSLRAGPSQPAFRDMALKFGLEATRPSTGGDPLPSTAWHPEWVDVNDDGYIDLFVSKGNVDRQPDYAVKDPSDLFLGQPDGTFVQVAEAAGILSFARGRGASLADFNLDGLPDLVVVNYRDPVMVWRNVGSGSAAQPAPMGHWLAVRVSQPGPNGDAIGAWIEVKVGDTTMRRELTIGGGHLTGQLGWQHFGLGSAREAQVRVQWPDGTVGAWTTVAADQFSIIDRATGQARPWSPGTP